MNRQKQLDRQMPVFQEYPDRPVDFRWPGRGHQATIRSLLRPGWLLMTGVVAFLAAVAHDLYQPGNFAATSIPGAGSPPGKRIPADSAAAAPSAARIPVQRASHSALNLVVKPAEGHLMMATPALLSIQSPDVEKPRAEPSAALEALVAPTHVPDTTGFTVESATAARPGVNKTAFFGEVFGVASITMVLDEETSPVVMPDQPIGIMERDNRVSYGIVIPKYRNGDDGDYLLAGLDVHFLFRGGQPLDISLHTPQGEIPVDGIIQVLQDPAGHKQLLEKWWAAYSPQRDEASSELNQVHGWVTGMLARRLDLVLPQGRSKDRGPRAMAKVEQDFERILGTLLGIDSILIAMGNDSDTMDSPERTADQRLPTAVNIRAVNPNFSVQGTTVEKIAMRVPQECFYVRCGTLHNYEWLRSFLVHWNGSLEEIVKVAATDRNVRQRLEKQLALDLESCKQLGLEKEISDFALVGSDLNFDDGPAIGVIIEARDVAAVQRVIGNQRQKALSVSPDARNQTIQILGRPVSFVHSGGNAIRSFYVAMGKYHLVTNSEFIARRFIQSENGQGSLGQLNEFLLARQKVPSGGANVVQIYLSDPFFREVVSPKYRIESARRRQAADDLKQLALASAIARAEGVDRISVERLRELEYLPWQFNQRADASLAQIDGTAVIDSLRGAWGTFKPVADMQIDRATRAEVSDYQRFAAKYQQQWRQMDPVVANLSVSPGADEGTENVNLDILVVPFARQRYEVFNRYLAGPTSQEIDTRSNDLIAVTAGLRGPSGGTMMTRMGIRDDAMEYRIENGKVRTVGKDNGRTLAGSNQYVLVDSEGTGGLQRLGEFVESMQGDSPVPSRSTARMSFHFLDLMIFLPRLLGSVAKADAIETEGGWTVMSAKKELREQIVRASTLQPATATAQVRFRMPDVRSSQAYEYVSAYTYMELHRVSSANAAALNYIGQQLPGSLERAPDLLQQVLGVKLVCPLGREYRLADRAGYRYWTPSTDDTGSYFDITSVPEDYSFPFLNWLRGVELEFNLSGDTLTSNVRLKTRQTLPGHTFHVQTSDPQPQTETEYVSEEAERAIETGDTIVVTAGTAKLKVGTAEKAEVHLGQCLPVLHVQENWIWTFAEENGVRTYGWIDHRQVTRQGQWALAFDGDDDFVSGTNIALDSLKSFTVEAWVRDWNGAILCQGQAGDPENSFWLSTGTRTHGGLPHESCGWESNAGTNHELVVGMGDPGEWNHLAMVYDGARQSFFLNGQLLSSQNAARPGLLNRSRRLMLGVHDYGEGMAFGSGAMSSIRISRLARYQTGFSPPRNFCADADTLLLYHFSEGKGATLHDASGHKRDATVRGAQWIRTDQATGLTEK